MGWPQSCVHFLAMPRVDRSTCHATFSAVTVVSPDDVTARHKIPGVSHALAELRDHAQRQLDDSGFARIGGTAAAALLPLGLVGPLLKKLRRQDQDPFAAIDLPQWRKQWVLWRTARRRR